MNLQDGKGDAMAWFPLVVNGLRQALYAERPDK
jgi:hypothetical protein